MVSSLRQLGFVIEHEPQGTFYIWACLANLPQPLNDCERTTSTRPSPTATLIHS